MVRMVKEKETNERSGMCISEGVRSKAYWGDTHKRVYWLLC